MANLVYLPGNFFFFFDISLLYYYINLRSSIIFCLSSGDAYFSLRISMSCSFVIVFELFYGELLETLILLAILLPIKSPVVSVAFLIILFVEVLRASVADCLAWSRRYWLYLPLKFLLIFLLIFFPILLAKYKNS